MMNEKKDLKTLLDSEKRVLSVINKFGITGVAASKKKEDIYQLEGYVHLILCLLETRMGRLKFYGGVSDFGDVTKKKSLLSEKLEDATSTSETPVEFLKNIKEELCALITSANENKLLKDDEPGDLRGVLRKI